MKCSAFTHQSPDVPWRRSNDGCCPGHVVHECQLPKEARVVIVPHHFLLTLNVNIYVVHSTAHKTFSTQLDQSIRPTYYTWDLSFKRYYTSMQKEGEDHMWTPPCPPPPSTSKKQIIFEHNREKVFS